MRKYEIISKRNLNDTVVEMVINAPDTARHAEPGQFIILRSHEDGERIPLTIADFDRVKGTVTIMYQIVGGGTMRLDTLNQGDALADFAGPLGKPSEVEGLKKVAVVGGGVGCAIAYPVAKKLHNLGTEVHMIAGFRSRDIVILEDEMKAASSKFILMSDDGTVGKKGLVTNALKELLDSGEKYDEVIAIGPLPMMKFVCLLTKEYGVKTVVSMNPIMVDGTGMCGGCRLTVGGKTKFACVDGPEFDGHQVDFDEAMTRSRIYRDFESKERDHECNLTKEAK
jgi:ferredoxin--NADP+ reductase